jgi:hypothetical protein
MGAYRSRHGREGRSRRRVPAFDRIDCASERQERGQAIARFSIAFIGDVVRGACEAIDRSDGVAMMRREQERCDGKVFVVTDGQGGRIRRATHARGVCDA